MNNIGSLWGNLKSSPYQIQSQETHQKASAVLLTIYKRSYKIRLVCSWQRVRYYLEVGINEDFQKLSGFIDHEDKIYTSKRKKVCLHANHLGCTCTAHSHGPYALIFQTAM